MTDDPRVAFEQTPDAAQRIAGVIAARDRGDFGGANELLASMDDAARAAGGVFLADVVIALLARTEGRSVEQVAGELSLQLAGGL